MQDFIRSEPFFCTLETDETDDPRPDNNYVVTIEAMLIPKVITQERQVEAKKFHIKLSFPNQVNNETVSIMVDQVCFCSN